MIFIDTSAFHALYIENDINHQSALKVKRNIIQKKYGALITTNYIIDETLTLLRNSAGIINSIKIGELIRNSKVLNIIWIDDDIEENAWKIFSTYRDKTFSFTDCTSFVVMKEMSIDDSFTYDEHFEQMEFNLIQ